MAVKLGLKLPTNWGVMDPVVLSDMAVKAEEMGFASIWASQHLVNAGYILERLGNTPYYHPMAMLAFIAARTSKVQLGTSIVNLPFHHPFEIAKFCATLDHLSRGRVLFGVGVGGNEAEFEALNIPWRRRGAISDEMLDVILKLWKPGPADHQGKIWNFSNVSTSPKPYNGSHLPIIIGGMSDAALRRVARVGDGWIPTLIGVEQFREMLGRIRQYTTEAGRDPDALEIIMRFNVILDGQEPAPNEAAASVHVHDVERMVQIVHDFSDAGANHFVYALNTNDPKVVESTIDMIASRILPTTHA